MVATRSSSRGGWEALARRSPTAETMADESTWRWSLTALSPREWMQRLLLLLLLFCCLMGDFLLWQQVLFADWSLLRHLLDSGTHFAVGFCCWGIFLCFSHDDRIPAAPAKKENETTPTPVLDESAGRETFSTVPGISEWKSFLISCFLAGFTAAILDIDHFIAAGALSISGATHLEGRPFGHSVTFVIAVTVLVWAISKFRGASKWMRIHRMSFVIITLMSHQFRDGNRLGLWFWPIGSTPGIFYPIYLFAEVAMPIALARWQVMDGRKETAEAQADAAGVPEPKTIRDGDEDHIAVTVSEEHKTPPGPPQLF